jgi:two-component system, NtrC family, sensor kinase
MKIAVIGGGKRCLYLMDLVETHEFTIVHPVIIAVADIDESAPGFIRAKNNGIFTTTDYNTIFDLDDVELIIELTGSMDIYNDILVKKSKNVRALAHTTARLFWEISRVANLQNMTSSKLKRAQFMYDIMANHLIHEDVIVISPEYRVLDVNKAFLERTGLTRKEVIGKYCYEITHHQSMPCSGENHPCPLAQVLKKGKPAQATHIHLDKDENELHYSISCYPFIENDKIMGVIEVSKDITGDIKIQKAMMQQEKMVSIGRLSAGVAHEINNPLTTILTSSMLLQEDFDPESTVYQELQTIASETLRCRKIVKSLLDFSRQTRPSKKPFNMNDIVRESSVLTRKQAAFNDIGMESELADQLPLVHIDKDQIQQVLINLALNSIEATPAGGKVKFITRYLPEKKIVEVEVNDTGAGIPPEYLDTIFDPFFTTKENGTGLGLAITHGIIEQHGGTVTVKSGRESGTSFFIRFPQPTENGNDQ